MNGPNSGCEVIQLNIKKCEGSGDSEKQGSSRLSALDLTPGLIPFLKDNEQHRGPLSGGKEVWGWALMGSPGHALAGGQMPTHTGERARHLESPGHGPGASPPPETRPLRVHRPLGPRPPPQCSNRTIQGRGP